MPTFYYRAKKSPTEIVEETFDAETREDVLKHLSELGYAPLEVALKKSDGTVSRKPEKPVSDVSLPASAKEDMMRQFASLTRSQIPILQSLRILEEQSSHLDLKKIVVALRDGIENDGHSLSEAMRRFPRAFPPDIVNLIAAGEEGGALQEILDEIAERLEREQALRTKLQTAVMYPLFVGIVGFLTVVFLILFVLPKILKTLKSLGGHLPLPTQILVWITELTAQPLFWIAGALFTAVAIPVVVNLVRNQREKLDEFLLNLNGIGPMLQTLDLVRFTRSLGMLLHHGVLVLPALESAIPVVRNLCLRRELGRISDAVKEGNPLTEGFKNLRISTPYLIQSMRVAEVGGRMAETLEEVSDYYEKEAEKKMQRFAMLLEPVMILGVGVVVGFIVMAVLLPIFEVGTAVR